jgi:hypothetical protein
MDKDISSIHKDYKYQKVEWVIKRIYWVLMGIFIAFASLGAFGDNGSLLSRKEIKLQDATIEYEKFLRVDKSFDMKVNILNTYKECSVAINKDYVDKIQITQVIPEPSEVTSKGDKIIYKFRSYESGTITFFKDPLKMGSQKLEIEVNGKSVNISQFIYF